MLRLLTVLSVVFLMPELVLAQAKEAILRGTVTHSEGAVISSARVLLHWDSVDLKTNVGIREDRVAITNRDGNFEVRLPPGFYDVFASASAFSPHCQKIRINRDSNLLMKLDLDPVVSKELGGMEVSPGPGTNQR